MIEINANVFFIVLTIITTIVILFFISRCKIKTLEECVSKASQMSEFNPTFFEIYSASDTECDRFIIVQPFGWYIWATSGKVYVLNQSSYECGFNQTPAVVIPSVGNTKTQSLQLNTVCLNILLSSLITSYKQKKGHIIYYDISKLQSEENKFTVIDALNFLFTKYITMTALSNTSIANYSVHDLVSNIDSLVDSREYILKNFSNFQKKVKN